MGRLLARPNPLRIIVSIGEPMIHVLEEDSHADTTEICRFCFLCALWNRGVHCQRCVGAGSTARIICWLHAEDSISDRGTDAGLCYNYCRSRSAAGPGGPAPHTSDI